MTVLVDRHTCVSTMRSKTKTLSRKWVANKAMSILRDDPKIGALENTIMVQLKANTRGLGHIKIVPGANWSVEVWDYSRRVERHIVKLNQRTCTCLEWQHNGKPCQHALAFVTREREVDLEQFVHEYYSVNRFRAAYGREIEPLTDKIH